MNKLECGVISDLLPLYADGVCSEESRALIERHLEECQSCAEALERLKSAVPLEKDAEGTPLKKLKKKLRVRRTVIIAVTALLTAFLLLIGYYYLFQRTMALPYEELKGECYAEIADDGLLWIRYEGAPYDSIASHASDDGSSYLVCFRYNLWTKLFGPRNTRVHFPFEVLNVNGVIADLPMVDYGSVVYQGFEVDASGNTKLVGGAHTLWQK